MSIVKRADFEAELRKAGVNAPLTRRVWIWADNGEFTGDKRCFWGAIIHNGHNLFVGYNVKAQIPFVVKEVKMPMTLGDPIQVCIEKDGTFRDSEDWAEMKLATAEATACAVRDWA